MEMKNHGGFLHYFTSKESREDGNKGKQADPMAGLVSGFEEIIQTRGEWIAYGVKPGGSTA